MAQRHLEAGIDLADVDRFSSHTALLGHPLASTRAQRLAWIFGPCGMRAHHPQQQDEQRGVRAESVNIGEIDTRLKVPLCHDRKGWQYDFPSAQQQSLRARCAEPVAQFFLNVNVSGPRTAASAARTPNAQEARDSRPVVVLRQGLLRGTRLTAEHLELLQWPAGNVPLQSIDNMDNAINAELTRDVLAGKPIRSTDLRPALLVKRGQTVTLTIRQEGGFAVTAQLEALQDGRKDDSIRLKNPESGRILTGKVVGLNSVEGQ
jgi:flagella basal body P-ring formation protein FlgA